MGLHYIRHIPVPTERLQVSHAAGIGVVNSPLSVQLHLCDH